MLGGSLGRINKRRLFLIRWSYTSIWYWLITLSLMPLFLIGTLMCVLLAGLILLVWHVPYTLLKWEAAWLHSLRTTTSEKKEAKW